MELLSLYITDYRKINGQGFHFSSKYIIEYFGTEEKMEIRIKSNLEHIPNFFGYTNIKSVTGIIGQNGAGKTSTLDFIKNNLSNGELDMDGYSIVIIEKDEDDEYDGREERKRIYFPSHWNVTISDETSSFTAIPILNDKRESVIQIDRIESFEDVSIVFYSNIFDGKEEREREGCFDISTNSLLRKDYKRYTEIKQVDAFNDSELLRQLLFIASEKPQKELPFKLPNSLYVSVLLDDQSSLRKSFEDYGLIRILDAYSDTSYVYKRTSSYEDLFITELFIAAFFNFIRSDFEFMAQPILKESFAKVSLENIKQAIGYFFYNISRNQEHPYSDQAKIILDFLEYAEDLITRQILHVGGQLPSYPLDLEDYRPESELFINKYNKAKSFTNFLKFDWSELSSGQKSLLNIFSRFYSLADEVNPESERLKKNILILFDEGDLYFHPEWQRRFFKIILDFLASLFPNKKIQLVLASNSPFLASDLPKSNVVFINKDREVLPSINSREETFASNIHTLFADSFFMDEALIGDFAKLKIDEIIDYLQSNQYNTDLTEKYRAIVNIIGEPVIKYKIEELWIEKMGREEEIKILQNRIDQLQARTDD